jgi:hypothetical protein
MDPFAPGPRMEMDIPNEHPWVPYIDGYVRRSTATNLIEHGIMTVTLGGVEQLYDLVSVPGINYRNDSIVTNWRMFSRDHLPPGLTASGRAYRS